ncbi:transposase [Betaproteobacteria bacterium SCN1]|jgi:putative transposase|nr:transposase [Betaproteobacteria bacterium SCN1]
MARLPRYVIPGQPQHIIQRGNNRQAIFAAEADYQFFRDALVEAALKHGLRIHAYVWMTNHIHLLATPEFDDSISKVFQSVGRKYVQYFRKRRGQVFYYHILSCHTRPHGAPPQT